MLTERQKQMYDFLVDYTARKGRAPSYREIMVAVGWQSLNTVSQAVRSMAKKGYIEHVEGVNRGIRLLPTPEWMAIQKNLENENARLRDLLRKEL